MEALFVPAQVDPKADADHKEMLKNAQPMVEPGLKKQLSRDFARRFCGEVALVDVGKLTLVVVRDGYSVSATEIRSMRPMAAQILKGKDARPGVADRSATVQRVRSGAGRGSQCRVAGRTAG